MLLQASTKERRTIFEEAAGISRFKAKKIETLRKLERVDQNLQRLKDIVDEVEKQLRSVKLQAAKAQRYQEYSAGSRNCGSAWACRSIGQLAEKLEAENRPCWSSLRTGLRSSRPRPRPGKRSGPAGGVSWPPVRRGRPRTGRAALARPAQQIATEETTLEPRTIAGGRPGNRAGRGPHAAWPKLTERVAGLARCRCRGGCRGSCRARRDQASGSRCRPLEDELQGAIEPRWRNCRPAGRWPTRRSISNRCARSAHLQNDVVACKAQVDNLSRERDRLRNESARWPRAWPPSTWNCRN